MCLVGEAQKPAECVSTVNIDYNTIHRVRCSGQLTPGGDIAMETSERVLPHRCTRMFTATATVTYEMCGIVCVRCQNPGCASVTCNLSLIVYLWTYS